MRQDPICLFRLVKLILKYESLNFRIDGYIVNELKQFGRGKPIDLCHFISVGKSATRHASRAGHAIKDLLIRFPAERVLTELTNIGILQTLSGFTTDFIHQVIPHLADYIDAKPYPEQKKEALCIIFSGLYLKQNGSEHFDHWPFFAMARHLPPRRKGLYGYLKQELCGIPSQEQFYGEGEALTLINELHDVTMSNVKMGV